jgi:predicted acetyltransferase
MTQFLDIHIAGDAERCQAHENCHDVWSLGLSLTDHVTRRESSALHCRARWIVGCIEGRVVAALASHPLRFLLHGRSFPGIGIASVHTLQEFRGQGLAQRMIRWIESFEQHEGARISTLFCDIEPRYYERLGYTLCPSHLGIAKTDGAVRTESLADGWRLVPVAADEEFSRRLPRLAEIYASDHGRRALAIERTPDYWTHLAARLPGAEHFWLLAPTGQEYGYAWLTTADKGLVLQDHAVRGGDAATREALLRLVICLGRERGMEQVGGWLPAVSPASELFTLTPRKTEITMVKSLDLALSFDAAALAAADWWQEIDHV